MDGARHLLNQILEQDPENLTAMTHLFNMDKIDPESPQFHATVKRLLSSMPRSKDMDEKFYAFYKEYIRLTRKPQLPAGIYARTADIAASKGEIDTAEKIISMLLKKKPATPGHASSLLKLSIAFGRKNMDVKRKTCLKILHSRFPHTSEAQVAKRALSR